MKKGKHSLTISSDDKNVIANIHSFLVNDGDEQCIIYDENGEEAFYPEFKWNIKNRKDLDIVVECDYKHKYEG